MVWTVCTDVFLTRTNLSHNILNLYSDYVELSFLHRIFKFKNHFLVQMLLSVRFDSANRNVKVIPWLLSICSFVIDGISP